ncbi:dihydrodipicolinate synthase family protein [Dactylosporangium sp. AC04546]|uniref:dihydrodipicolinate synthase family protein n=1 Tax=Dactylosporangium sp. AC04546 TaxID=2862460 RepID=UPI001EDF0663|nr:dihydrodipicolinate synthase family protein [Dactylosporangium sp. AC04546]WVK87808.1 dihydrodipicolinate synthase family protein [Dactylosporangium sp. AC04546]
MDGIYVPLITPFDTSGSVDLDALHELAGSLLADGVAGFVALGTTGEPATLSEAERDEVVAVCAKLGAPLIVGAGGSGTAATVEALRRLPSGVTAMVMVPPYLRPGPAGVLAHFRAVAAASPVPVVVYHVPYRTGQALDLSTLLEIAAIPGVAGMKLSDGPISGDTVELLGAVPAGFPVLGGDDAVISPLLALGAAGGILASAHIDTAAFVELYAAWSAGDVARARPLGRRLAGLSRALFAEPNPAVIKAVLHAEGRIASPAVRLPLLPASPEALAAVARFRDLNRPGRS